MVSSPGTRRSLSRPLAGNFEPGRYARDHLELLVLAGMLLSLQLFPRHVPGGIYGIGIVSGSSVALQAAGVILVYRSNRIVNFAQVQIGLVSATVFSSLVGFTPLLRAFTSICPGCRVTPGVRTVNYWVSLVLTLAFSVLLAYAVYVFVIRRFANAPRLVVTIATIFLAQLLGGLQGLLPTLLSTEEQRLGGIRLEAPRLPFHWAFTWAPARFETSQLLIVVAAVAGVIGVTAYFRLSDAGVAIRASAANPSRAQTLGVDVKRVTGRVWVIAGLLSAVAAIIASMSSAPSGQASFNASQTLRILAAAVIAGMTNVPVAAVAAIVIGILFQGVVWSYGSNVFLDTVLFAIVLGVLLVQARGGLRPDVEQASAWRAAREIRRIPKELRSIGVVRGWMWTGAVLAAAALLGFPWAMSVGQTSLGVVVLVYAIVGMSLLVLTGWAGQVSLGQFAFAAVGAYVAAVSGAPFLLALPVGAATGAVAALVVALPALRLRGLALAVSTLGFAVAVPTALLNPTYLGKHLPSSLHRPSLLGINLEEQRSYYYFTLAALVLVVILVVGLHRGRMARALIAGRDNERAAQSFGINLTRARLEAYAVSGFISGLAGVIYAFHLSGVRPSAFAAEQSVTIFIMAVIGGLGGVAGPLIGAVYVGALTVLSASPVVVFLATGGGGLLLLLFVPGGLGQIVFGARDALLRRLAERRGIVVPSLLADVAADGQVPRARIAPRRRAVSEPAPTTYRLRDQWAHSEADPHGSEPQAESELARG